MLSRTNKRNARAAERRRGARLIAELRAKEEALKYRRPAAHDPEDNSGYEGDDSVNQTVQANAANQSLRPSITETLLGRGSSARHGAMPGGGFYNHKS